MASHPIHTSVSSHKSDKTPCCDLAVGPTLTQTAQSKTHSSWGQGAEPLLFGGIGEGGTCQHKPGILDNIRQTIGSEGNQSSRERQAQAQKCTMYTVPPPRRRLTKWRCCPFHVTKTLALVAPEAMLTLSCDDNPGVSGSGGQCCPPCLMKTLAYARRGAKFCFSRDENTSVNVAASHLGPRRATKH